MARLKFGNFEVRAEMPKLAPVPVIGPGLLDNNPLIHQDFFQKLKDMIPEPQPLKEQDLSPIYKEIEKLRTDLFHKVNEQKPSIPEVKNITHIQDVSSDVVKRCKEMIQQSEINMGMKINGLHKQNKRQKTINISLSCALILTIFLHLL